MGCSFNDKQPIIIAMSKFLNGKVALVTGAGSGIGKAIALALSRNGALLAVADINQKGVEDTVAEIKESGGQAIAFKVDVSKSSEVDSMTQEVIKHFGRLDCAVNNAGIEGSLASTTDCTEENWDRVMEVNVKGIWLCMKYQIIQMLMQGKGSVVNMSSALGLVGMQGYPAYVASKHGVVGLTKTAALEYAPHGVRVNAICPGVIETPLLDRMVSGKQDLKDWLIAKEPIGRLGTPQEVAEAAVWLCSDASSFVTGHCMSVDGGAVAQ